MRTSRFFMVAVATTLLSTASFASPPSAVSVAVPQGEMTAGHSKLQALFDSPEEFMMFKVQLHQATKGMTREQKKAYRKDQLQKIKVMNTTDQAAWRQGLEAQWNALPDARKTRIAQKMDAQMAKHQPPNPNTGQNMGTPQ